MLLHAFCTIWRAHQTEEDFDHLRLSSPQITFTAGVSPSTTAMHADVRVLSLNALQRIVCRGDVGLGEAFMAREFEVNDLGSFATVLAANQPSFLRHEGRAGLMHWLGSKALLGSHLMRPTSIEGLCITFERFLDSTGAPNFQSTC